MTATQIAKTDKGTSLYFAARWSLIGQVCFYGLQWLNMIALARLSGPEALGLYTLGLAIANPVMALAGLKFRMVYITEIRNRWGFREFEKLSAFSIPIGVAAILLVAYLLGYREIALIAIMLAASWKTAEVLSELNYSIPHKHGAMQLIAGSMILRAAISTVVLITTLYLTDDLIISLCFFSASWWVCFLFVDRKLSQGAEPKAGDTPTNALFWLALPMAASASLVYLTNSVPRIVLDQFESTEVLGVFAAVSHLMLIGTMMLNSFASVITPRLSRFYAEGDTKRFYSEAFLLIGVSAFASLSFMIVSYFGGNLILYIIYGEAMEGYGSLIFMISLASFPMYIGCIMGFIPPALQAFRFHLSVNVLTVVVVTVTALALIPTLGLTGAVYALAIQGIVQLLNGLILLRKPPKFVPEEPVS